MKTYIGVKVIEAEPAKEPGEIKPTSFDPLAQREPRDGYRVRYSDDYESWSPKAVFEEAYVEVPADSANVILDIVRERLVNEALASPARSSWTTWRRPSMAKPPKTGPAKYVAHLLGDDKASLWCGHKPGHRHRVALTLDRVTCPKCRKLRDAALAREEPETVTLRPD